MQWDPVAAWEQMGRDAEPGAGSSQPSMAGESRGWGEVMPGCRDLLGRSKEVRNSMAAGLLEH